MYSIRVASVYKIVTAGSESVSPTLSVARFMTMVRRIMRMINGRAPAPAPNPSWTMVPTPTPIVPAIIAVTIVWAIETIPGVIPWIVPAVAIVPHEGVIEMTSMIAD
jgi:hypothetical protein